MSVYEKLLAIQTELKAPKSLYNSFGKYNYRKCEDILEALKPLCAKHRAVVKLTDSVKEIENRFYVESTAIIIDVETGDRESATALAREEETKKGMDGSQITGTSSSYARKYALSGLFAIDDTADSDTTNNGEDTTQGEEKTPREQLIEKLKEKGINVNAFAKEHNVTPKTTDEQFIKLLERIDNE